MLIPVILSGGAGTRLWPVSRETHPKSFMHLGGGKSLLTQTYERATSVAGRMPLIVTNSKYYFLSCDELNNQTLKPHYLLEPKGRNTAPAIALAALWAQQYGDPCLLIMPADHLIKDVVAFSESVKHAASLAENGALVLFGIQPTAPETGFGYIEMGDALDHAANTVHRFVEKPDSTTARAFLAQGNHVWNSGIFCFRASAILNAFEEHVPALLVAAKEVFKNSQTDTDKTELPSSFAEMESISIDCAVMERAKNIAVIPGNFGWSDIGSWNAVSDALQADARGNTSSGQNIAIDCQNIHIESDGRLVAAIGLDNLIIVDTPDALLVADKRNSQDVGKVVEQLKVSGSNVHKLHRTASRPWGTYTVLEEGAGFKIKRIVVKPGASLSLQMHHHRSEHWVVVSGTAKVTVDDRITLVAPNQSTYIPIGAKHRLNNPDVTDLVIIEVQCGNYLDEDDIVRFTDNYGRS